MKIHKRFQQIGECIFNEHPLTRLLYLNAIAIGLPSENRSTLDARLL